jgi:hypothetical protein
LGKREADELLVRQALELLQIYFASVKDRKRDPLLGEVSAELRHASLHLFGGRRIIGTNVRSRGNRVDAIPRCSAGKLAAFLDAPGSVVEAGEDVRMEVDHRANDTAALEERAAPGAKDYFLPRAVSARPLLPKQMSQRRRPSGALRPMLLQPAPPVANPRLPGGGRGRMFESCRAHDGKGPQIRAFQMNRGRGRQVVMAKMSIRSRNASVKASSRPNSYSSASGARCPYVRSIISSEFRCAALARGEMSAAWRTSRVPEVLGPAVLEACRPERRLNGARGGCTNDGSRRRSRVSGGSTRAECRGGGPRVDRRRNPEHGHEVWKPCAVVEKAEARVQVLATIFPPARLN